MKKELAEEMIRRVLPSYEMKEMLGEGSFGAVFRISDSLKERAVKIISLSAAPSIERGSVTSADKKIERDFRHIVESYEKIACEEIVTVYDFFKLSDSDDGRRQATSYAVVVMELYPSNRCEYVVEHFEKNEHLLPIATAKSMIEKLAHLLGNLYTKRGFLFEDLKPENILIREQEGNLKLVVGDIGGLKNLGSVSTTSSQVTLSYCAPEVIRRGQKPDLRSILYSYGIISYFILEGHLPYENYGITERIDMIKDKGVLFDRRDIPVQLQEVIR
jgi:serine/threonine protein kinase